ncbi:hypothetical protein ES288_A03G057400v1 [Gossypium darwinii]|uniref:Uncharacterized protein n=1 Tax=Gossypium darwinii TaxID=34276 RepID=A0A5D2H214_GOSDA|nr:hypothetical protein ES288_A03G057400v1 [Gossypium darwinii]
MFISLCVCFVLGFYSRNTHLGREARHEFPAGDKKTRDMVYQCFKRSRRRTPDQGHGTEIQTQVNGSINSGGRRRY